MTSSNETSVTDTLRTSRTFTWIAVLTALLTVSAFGFVVYKVNALESEYGEIRASKERILRDIESGQEQKASLLSDIESGRQELAGLNAEVAQAQTLQSQLSGLNEQVDQARNALTEISQRTADAEQVIALSAGATTALARIKDEQNDLTRRIEQLNRDAANAENEARSFLSSRDQLQDEVRDLEIKKRERDALLLELNSASSDLETLRSELDGARGDLAQNRVDADTAERRAAQAQGDLDRLLPLVETARGELNSIRAEISTETASMEGLRRDAEILDTRVANLSIEEERLILFEGRVDQALARLADVTAELREVQENRIQTEADLEVLRDEQIRLRNLNESLAGLQNQQAETRQEISALEALVEGRREAQVVLAAELAELRAQMETETVLLSQRRNARLAEEARIAQIQSKAEVLAETEEELARRQPELVELEARISEARNRLASLQGQTEAERQKLSALESKVQQLSAPD